MKEIMTAEVIQTQSIGEIIQDANISRFRKWLLKKLMPKELFEAPPQKIAQLQKGSVIGSITFNVSYPEDSIDLGV